MQFGLVDSVSRCFYKHKQQQIDMNLWTIYTSGLGTVYKDKLFAMLPALVATGTIMTSQVNVVAST